MNKLLKEYGFEVVEDYFNMITESFVSDNKKQAREQYRAMSDAYKDMYFVSCDLSRKDLLFLNREENDY